MRSIIASCLIFLFLCAGVVTAGQHDGMDDKHSMSDHSTEHEHSGHIKHAEHQDSQHTADNHSQTGTPSMLPSGNTPNLTGHVHTDPPEDSPMAGVDEKLGDRIPSGITMYDEQGNAVDVLSLLDRPTIIAPVYYTCPSVCNILQSAIARVLPQVSLEAGKEYRVLSVTFDELDTIASAKHKQQQYYAAMDFSFPEGAWKFLTGDKESIHRLMDSIGFRFTRQGKDFVHAVALIVVAPEGKIVRYLYGNGFLPFDVTMALTEAQSGKVGLSLKRMVSFCFTYDPEGRRYVFDFMRVAGGIVLFGAFVLFLVLTRGGRKRSRNDA